MDNEITLNLNSKERKMIHQVLVEGYFDCMTIPERSNLYNLANSIETTIHGKEEIKIKKDGLGLIISSLKEKTNRLEVLGHNSINDWNSLKKIYKEKRLCDELMEKLTRIWNWGWDKL